MNKLIIFSGPSGSGKTTIARHLLSQNANLGFSVSATTRVKRDNEQDGVDYYFLSREAFLSKIEKGEFLEWQQVYRGVYYGTLKSEVERIWALNKYVVFDIDVVGGLNVKNFYGATCLAIFVMPPSLEELQKRLRKRATESAESFKKRIAKAEFEISFANRFDKILFNNGLEESFHVAQELVNEFVG